MVLRRPQGGRHLRRHRRRQVEGWTRRWHAARTEPVPDVDWIAAWLLERIPPERGSPVSSGRRLTRDDAAGYGAAMEFHRFDEPGKVRLADISEEPPEDISKEDARKQLDTLSEELAELQGWMWGARTHSVLLVLQGRDAAGKDGAIKRMAGALNLRGVLVTSFGVPTQEEREHDFLWRVHGPAPRAGRFSIFNRSHYEDVLVVRVRGLVPQPVWKGQLHHPQDLPACQQGRAEETAARAREGSHRCVEAEPRRLERSRVMGRIHRGV
jgi:hypothetical protein